MESPPLSELGYERLLEVLRRAIRVITRLYPSGTHFVYELIQNADDALGNVRATPDGQRKGISFVLRADEILVSNNGRPFDDGSVAAICSIGESTKDLTQIGTHGIGFKAVYTCTDQPEIYSGDRCFRIFGGIQPVTITITSEEIQRLVVSKRTVFRLPFTKRMREGDIDRIGIQLQGLDRWSLLFLRNLEVIEWSDERLNLQGIYSASRHPHELVAGAQRVELRSTTGEEEAQAESFLVFRRDVPPMPEVIADLLQRAEYDDERERIERSAKSLQPIEIAFQIHEGKVCSITNPVLFAYLPTSIETHLRFVVQARYQTIPSRNAINEDVLWNSWLMQETADLIPDVLEHLKVAGMLTASLFEALPSPSDNIDQFMQPIRDASRRALLEGALIPTEDGRYFAANCVFYPHTKSVRTLFSTSDLAEITRTEEAAWLQPDIQANDRALEILRDVRVREMTAAQIVVWLCTKDPQWYEAKDDQWMRDLYIYLAQQKAEHDRLKSAPLARLESGKHVNAIHEMCFFPPQDEAQKAKFRPFLENLPVFKIELLDADSRGEVKPFLEKIGIAPLNPVRLLSGWLLPQYKEGFSISTDENHFHVAFLADTLEALLPADAQALVESVGNQSFLLARTGPGEPCYLVSPNLTYLPQAYTGTNDLETYFVDAQPYFVDESYITPDRNVERWNALFKRIGVASGPRRIQTDDLSWTRRIGLIANTGHTHDVEIVNWELDGLTTALKRISARGELALSTALSIWRLLLRIIPSNPSSQNSFFQGLYRWKYRTVHSEDFPADFYENLMNAAWIPDQEGEFHKPSLMFVDSPETRAVLGDSVPYLHPELAGYERSSESRTRVLIDRLGINLNAKAEQALSRLQKMSGHEVALGDVDRIYSFLQSQKISGRETLFASQPLLYTPTPTPRWWTADRIFWNDERAIFDQERGYLTSHYPSTLKSFFVGQGVRPGATFADYVQAALEATAHAEVTEIVQVRMRTLYRHFFAELPNEASLDESTTIQEDERRILWQKLWATRCWLGKCGDQWDFYHKSDLVWNDHDYYFDLFAKVVPFWPFPDLVGLAGYLEVMRCSQAQIEFIPLGERSELEDWTRKTQILAPLIADFMASPQLNQGRDTDLGLDVFSKLTVALVERAQVAYRLQGVDVTEPEPRSSYLQVEESALILWITLDAEESEYPDLVGDAIQTHFGVAQLREFISSILKATNEQEMDRVLVRWKKRGLRYQPLPAPSPDSNGDSEGEDQNSEADRSVSDVATETEVSAEDNDASKPHSSIGTIAGASASDEASSSHRNGSHQPEKTSEMEPTQQPSQEIGSPASSPLGTSTYSGGSSSGKTGRTPGGGIGSGGGGGVESEIHKALKAKIGNYPHLCGAKLTFVQYEYRCPSGDEVDVLLRHATGAPIAVEVKPFIRSGDYSPVWQAVKYKHLLAVEYGVPCVEIRSILVAPSIPSDVRAKCSLLGIDFLEVSLP